MGAIQETIPDHLTDAAEAARAWFSRDRGHEFKLTGIVAPPDANAFDPTRPGELQLILCGIEAGQEACLRERFEVHAEASGFAVAHLDDAPLAVGSPAPELDPPAGTRTGWLDAALDRHAFVVLLFYRGFW